MELTLAELVTGLPGALAGGDTGVRISRVTADSREAGRGVLFVAVRGTTADGHRFVAQAIGAGCAAVALEDEPPAGAPAWIRMPDTRPAPALAARMLEGCPDRDLATVGITGTNGKTTTAFLMQSLLRRLRGECGLLGTIRYDDGVDGEPAPLTTPGGPVLYHWLARMRDNGCRGVALEVSSHALDQQRVAGLELDVAVMTNLGRDHLDYHADMDDYLRAKALIADRLRPEGDGGPGGALVLNAADPRLAGLRTAAPRVIRFAAAAPVAEADLEVVDARLDLHGTRLEVDWRGERIALQSPLVGRFNVENLTAALAAGLALGHDPAACAEALAGVEQVPGRMERLPLPGGAVAVVDYAHTHDALAAVLGACDELSEGRLLVVFGCGGDRDRGKRPLMGEVAARGADRVWITSDNPRSEDPAAICRDIEKGYAGAGDRRATACETVVARGEAIAAALEAAHPGDIVVIAGKGHEDYQLVGDRRLDFDDRQEVRRWCAERDHGC